MKFKCPNCKETSKYVNVETRNTVSRGKLIISGDKLVYETDETIFDDAVKIYTCPYCGKEIAVNNKIIDTEEDLLKYLKVRNLEVIK